MVEPTEDDMTEQKQPTTYDITIQMTSGQQTAIAVTTGAELPQVVGHYINEKRTDDLAEKTLLLLTDADAGRTVLINPALIESMNIQARANDL